MYVCFTDKDEIIGKRTKIIRRRALVMKKETSDRAKVVVFGSVESKSPPNMRIGTREGSEKKSSLKAKKRS